MRRRAVYRWKSFWLGVLVLVFLAWAWERSTRMEDGLSVVAWTFKGDGANAVSVLHAWGKIDVTWEAEPFMTPGVRSYYRPLPWQLKDPVVLDFSKGHYQTRVVASHGFLMVLFGVLWGGWLVWRWRKEKRKVMV